MSVSEDDKSFGFLTIIVFRDNFNKINYLYEGENTILRCQNGPCALETAMESVAVISCWNDKDYFEVLGKEEIG